MATPPIGPEPYKALVHAMADVVFTTDREGRMAGLQPSWQNFTGQTPAEYHEMGGFAMIHPDDRESVVAAWQLALAECSTMETEYRLWQASTRTWRDVAARAVYVPDSDPSQIQWIGILQDITERKQASRELHEKEERYRFLAEAIPQMLWTATPDGLLDYVSRQVVDYFGRASETLVGVGWVDGVHPEDQAHAIETWQKALSAGETYETAFRLLRGMDGTWRWHLVRGLPMKDRLGAVLQWFGTCTDIHDQKETEARLVRANRELEEFAYVVSHDLREPLRMVNIYAQVLIENAPVVSAANPRDNEAALCAGFISSGVSRMEALIADLLAFSTIVHAGNDRPVSVADLNVSLRYAIEALQENIGQTNAEIQFGNLPVVPGDEHQFAQVFQNLVGNAIKYKKPDQAPVIHISADADQTDWIITVCDNGIGFAPEYSERIFGLFKRLHTTEYPGTGLGLAICRRLLQRVGGDIHAESSGEGQGSRFYIRLPACPA